MSPLSANFFNGQNAFVTPEQKKQKKMIVILIAVVIAVLAVFYFGFFSSSSEQPALAPMPMEEGMAPALPGGETPVSSESLALKEVKLDFAVFEESAFKSLKQFAPPLDISGEKGRSNPFVPY